MEKQKVGTMKLNIAFTCENGYRGNHFAILPVYEGRKTRCEHVLEELSSFGITNVKSFILKEEK